MSRLLCIYVTAAALGLSACSAVDPTESESRAPSTTESRPVQYVIHLSIDGLRPDAITRHTAAELPAFYRLRSEGAFTDNARTDADYRITLPNHTDQLTGRPVLGPKGHGWTDNGTPEPNATLHSNRGRYVASAFDVAHDRGLRTSAYVSKSKFVLFDRSYDGENGAPDTTGADDGRDKIDTFVYERDAEALVSRLVADATADPCRYTFVHLRDPDSAGHEWSWSLNLRSPYMQAVRRMDRLVGKILDLIESDPRLAGRTALIITADHGGSDYGHSADRPAHFVIPFYVWGPGIPAADLYALNAGLLKDPEGTRPEREEPAQPIRNGAAANLALSLLGLEPVPGSTIHLSADGWTNAWAGR